MSTGAARQAEVHLPGVTSDDLRLWAQNVTASNPIGAGDTPFTPSLNLDITDYPFMGVELTFQSERGQLFTLALFAQVPNEKEQETMEADGVTAAGL